MKNQFSFLKILLIITISFLVLTACQSKKELKQPTPFEPKEQRIIVVGCEELKQRDPKADC